MGGLLNSLMSIGEAALPFVCPEAAILGPILGSLGQSSGAQGAQGAQQAGGLGQIAQEAEQLLQQFMSIFGQMGQQGGYTPGTCPQMPFPFSPSAAGIPSNVYQNPSAYLPNVGSGLGSSGAGNFNLLASQYNSAETNFQQAVAGGNPAQIAQAQQQLDQVNEAITALSDEEKRRASMIDQINQNMASG